MGTSCSKPTAPQPIVTSAPHEQVRDISILIEQINIGERSDVRMLKRTLRRNSLLIKKRIAFYDERLKKVDPTDSRVQTYIAEHARATELLATICRMQAAIELMA